MRGVDHRELSPLVVRKSIMISAFDDVCTGRLYRWTGRHLSVRRRPLENSVHFSGWRRVWYWSNIDWKLFLNARLWSQLDRGHGVVANNNGANKHGFCQQTANSSSATDAPNNKLKNPYDAFTIASMKSQTVPHLQLPRKITDTLSNCNVCAYATFSTVWRIESEEWMVFHAGHPADYWSPIVVWACMCACVLICQVFDIAAHLGN